MIVTLPRSGSYHLVSLLDSAADVVCHGELFKSGTVELSARHLARLGLAASDTAARDADPLQFLRRLRALNARKVFGFKMFLEHVGRVAALGALLRDRGWRKLVLTRNPIESYASLLRARATGVWTLPRASAAAVPRERLEAPVRFDPQSYAEHIALCTWFDGQMAELRGLPGQAVHTVDYRAVVDRGALPGLLDFIGSGARAAALRSGLDKQFVRPFHEGFSNWDELVAHARAQGHQAWLEDARAS